jgi:hypothetical protein
MSPRLPAVNMVIRIKISTSPNDLRLTRLAGCAGLGSSIHRNAEAEPIEDYKPKAKPGAARGWESFTFVLFQIPPQ